MLTDSMYDYRFEQPKAVEVDRCSICGKAIFTGETYYNFNGEIVCEESVDEYLSYCKKEAE